MPCLILSKDERKSHHHGMTHLAGRRGSMPITIISNIVCEKGIDY
jgi:hypothetical protein